MGVYIKGMQMPTRCLNCPMYDDFNFLCKLYSFRIPAKYNYAGATRPEWCPLVDLGKHGRMIDADKLMDDIKKNSASYFADDFAREWVDVQPTVIEAEDGTCTM